MTRADMKRPKVRAAHLLERLLLADDIVRQVRRKYRGRGPLPMTGSMTVYADARMVRAALGRRPTRLHGDKEK